MQGDSTWEEKRRDVQDGVGICGKVETMRAIEM